MASITIRNLDDAVKARLRVRAAKHGRSMEDEARDIPRTALAYGDQTERDLFIAIRRRFRVAGWFDLPVVPRQPIREPPKFAP